MPRLSKSKVIAARQCPKRVWLEVHRPELRADSATSEASFAVGNEVGALARHLYDPQGTGEFLDLASLGVSGLLQRTQALLPQRRTIFEAGFSFGSANNGALAIADVLRPVGRSWNWAMVEVKSSTSVKDAQRDDAAIQHHVAKQAGLALKRVAIAHINSSWTYPGDGDYQGLLVEQDLTKESASRGEEVAAWLKGAHAVVRSEEPETEPGGQCNTPYPCGFQSHCNTAHERRHGKVEHPVAWLPDVRRHALREHLASGARSLAHVPDDLLNETQFRVKQSSLSGVAYFDQAGAKKAMAPHGLAGLFLDFETIAYAVPRWAGTRPYESIPFQFSLHRMRTGGTVSHSGFLDLSGTDPTERFARALVAACEGTEPIYVYNRGFEAGRIAWLAARLPRLRRSLQQISGRLVDLWPITKQFYYHPHQQGSWSLKDVLPTIAPELAYENLTGVQDGGGAQLAYQECVAPHTTSERMAELDEQLWRYCRLDTFAMVRLWALLAGRSDRVQPADSAHSSRLH